MRIATRRWNGMLASILLTFCNINVRLEDEDKDEETVVVIPSFMPTPRLFVRAQFCTLAVPPGCGSSWRRHRWSNAGWDRHCPVSQWSAVVDWRLSLIVVIGLHSLAWFIIDNTSSGDWTQFPLAAPRRFVWITIGSNPKSCKHKWLKDAASVTSCWGTKPDTITDLARRSLYRRSAHTATATASR